MYPASLKQIKNLIYIEQGQEKSDLVQTSLLNKALMCK